MLPRPLPDPDVVARFSGLRADYATRVVFENVDLSLRRGLATVVCGANGAGKTTLLHTVADTAAGGVDEVALVPSEPHDFFFTDSVAQELSLADRAARCAPGTTKTTLESILSGQWRESVMATIATTHPRDLSRGQRTALAIAIQMSHRPRVLALDEPTRGLDQAATEALVEVLHCAAETGVAMLIATQEPKVFASLPGDTWELASGTLSPLSEVTR
jgi:energy-coupling factor transport system ATP-binding protein